MHTIILLEKHTSYKLITKLLYCRNYSTQKHSRGKKHSHNNASYDLQFKKITIQEDHNILTYSLFCLVVLAEESLRKPFLLEKPCLFVFLIFNERKIFSENKNPAHFY